MVFGTETGNSMASWYLKWKDFMKQDLNVENLINRGGRNKSEKKGGEPEKFQKLIGDEEGAISG